MPTEEEIAALLEQYYAEEQARYGVPDDFPVDNLTADPTLSIPLGGGSSVNPTLGYQNGMVTPGVAAQNDNFSGYANAEFNKMGPQAVNAGISGDRFNVDANIPISDPEALSLSGEADIAGNIITADWTPMEKALLFQLRRQF
jgi:hypothetical protein